MKNRLINKDHDFYLHTNLIELKRVKECVYIDKPRQAFLNN